jgi:hypothetical protein
MALPSSSGAPEMMEKVQNLKSSNTAPSSKTFGDELKRSMFLTYIHWLLNYPIKDMLLRISMAMKV